MGILETVVDAFIVAMGITPPIPEKKRTATIFIATALLGLTIALVALFLFVVTFVFRG